MSEREPEQLELPFPPPQAPGRPPPASTPNEAAAFWSSRFVEDDPACLDELMTGALDRDHA